jgi:hypothetical protein
VLFNCKSILSSFLDAASVTESPPIELDLTESLTLGAGDFWDSDEALLGVAGSGGSGASFLAESHWLNSRLDYFSNVTDAFCYFSSWVWDLLPLNGGKLELFSEEPDLINDLTLDILNTFYFICGLA